MTNFLYWRSLFSAVIFLCTLWVSPFANGQQNQPLVEEGLLIATDWNFLEGQPLQLSGNWEVIWGELVDPVEFDQKYKDEYYAVPSLWNGLDKPGVKGAYGVATFRVKLKLPQYNRNLSLHIISLNAAWRLYLDDVLLGENGTVSKDPKKVIPHYVPRTLPLSDGESVIIIQIANATNAYGGPDYILTAWDSVLLDKKLDYLSIYYILIIGALMTLGGYNFIIYLAGRNRLGQSSVHFWFSLMCLIIAVRIFAVVPFFHTYTADTRYWGNGSLTAIKISYVSIFANSAIIVLFFNSLFPTHFLRRLTKFMYLSNFLLAFIVIVLPEQLFTPLRSFMFLEALISLLYTFVFIFIAWRTKKRGALLMFFANTVFFFTCVNDVYIYAKQGGGYDLLPFGYLLLGFSFSYTVFMRLRETYQEVQETSDALTALNVGLEEQVRDRTKAFKSAAAKAQNHAHEKAQFIAAASHDLRQPLHALTMFNLALKRRSNDPNISDLLEKQGKSISNLGNLLQDTLDTAKIDSLNRMPEFSSIMVKKFLEKIYSGFDIQAETKGLKINRNVSSGYIMTDPAMLQRVLSNLIDNALKAAISRVDIHAKNKGPNWVFSITDDGGGIDPSDVHRIFQSYISLREEEPSEQGGYGLGLYVVNEFTKQLGGTIKIANTSSKGTTFVVTFSNSLDDGPTEKTPVDTSQANMSLRGLKILAIDDELEILDAMDAMLASWDCQISTANGLKQALNHIALGFRPDILIVDYHLQRTNGLSVINQLRNEVGQDLPAIVITGATEPEVLAKIKEAGLDVMLKPIEQQKLRNMLGSL